MATIPCSVRSITSCRPFIRVTGGLVVLSRFLDGSSTKVTGGDNQSMISLPYGSLYLLIYGKVIRKPSPISATRHFKPVTPQGLFFDDLAGTVMNGAVLPG